MNTQIIIYRISTVALSIFMLFSAFLYLSQAEMLVTSFREANLPLYLIPFLGLAKLCAAIVLLLPRPALLREWAYAGLSFTFTGATWVHLSTGTPFAAPLCFLALTVLSYTLGKRPKPGTGNEQKS